MAEAVSAAAAAASAVIQAKTTLWDPLKQTIASSNDMDEIHNAMDEALKMLVAKREDHQYAVQRYRTTRTPSNTYNNWIHRVNMVEDDVEKLKVRYIKERRRSRWFCFNPRSSFSEKMRRKGLQVIAIMEEGVQLGDFLIDKEAVPVVKMIAPEIANIPTLQNPLEEILGWLSDTKVKGIRIHGLVGSGKTTIMQNLNNHEKVAEMFDIVIWVTVSREGTKENMGIEHFQQVIAQRLKLDIKDTTQLEGVALRIREELKDVKYLLLLDDVKEDLDENYLHEIGVPTGDTQSKIVFTTRLRHVCSSITHRHTNVAKLKQKEALSMFKNVLARPDLEENPNVKRLMPLIVDLCGYHPLMIKVAAGSFRVKETEESWHDGLRNLRKWPEKGDDTMQETYKLLKCCFDCLKETQKTCFFYSALYPEGTDIHKNNLLDNWAAEDLLGNDDDDDDVEDIHVNGRDVLEHLKMVSLVEESICQHYIRMHKLIRQAALHNLLTNEDHHRYLVKSGEALQKPPNVEYWKEKSWISLVDSKLDALPDQPNCTTLSTLFLQKNPNLKAIPAAFFEHMHSLRVLDLYGTGITTLPVSLMKLVSLKVLYLKCCAALVKLPHEIKDLQKLEVLDIRGTGFASLPPQIQSLICLRRLLASFIITQDAVGNSKVISKISTLKELVIEIEESQFEIVMHDLIANVTISRLSLLQFCSRDSVIDVIKAVGDTRKMHFPSEFHLTSYLDRNGSFGSRSGSGSGSGSGSCQVFVGCSISSAPHIPEFSPYYKMEGEVSNHTISKVLHKAHAIEFVNHKELEHLSTPIIESMSEVRGCVIERCEKMRTVVDGNGVGSLVLPNMEQLHLINLPKLKSICEGPTQGLSKLKTLILCNCPMLSWVCASGFILQLPEIRHLEIKGCSGIEEIFTGYANAAGPSILPKLKKLVLVDMPQLRSILAIDSFEWPSLERLKINGCPGMKRLPFKKDAARRLRLIEAERRWWETLEDEEEVKQQFQPYCTLSS